VGNDDASPMRGVTGGSLPAAIWRDVMTAAEKGLPATPLDRSPPGQPVEDLLQGSGMPLNAADDESQTVTSEPQQEPQPQEQRHGNPIGSLFDWIFGSGEKKPAQNPSPQDSGDQN